MKSIFSKYNAADPTPEYLLRSPILNCEELCTYQKLCEVVDDHVVLTKVSLAELVDVPRPDRRHLTHWRRVQRRTIDFLICSTPALTPVLAVKMQTQADIKKHRAAPDILKQVLEDVGLPLLYLSAQHEYDVNDLSEKISFILNETSDTTPVPRPEKVTAATNGRLARTADQVVNIWASTKEKYQRRKQA